MDATRDYHTKRGKSERERQMPYDIAYKWNLNYDINEPIYKTETNKHREQTCGCQGERVGGRMEWQVDVNSYKMDKQQGPTV